MNFPLASSVVLVCGTLISSQQSLRADQIPEPYQKTVRKGLEWLASAQHRDGHWATAGDLFPVALTSLSGMALAMEASTIRGGKYADNIRRATNWLMNCVQPRGFINPFNGKGQGYMHGHGYALLFLAQVYGEEENAKRRTELEDILTRAVNFLGRSQSPNGGWGYFTSTEEGPQWDDVSVTAAQMQALRACRNAGIAVPKAMIDKAQKYFENCTIKDSGVRYAPSSSSGPARPGLTAAAIASTFSAGSSDSSIVKGWLKYCRAEVPRLTERTRTDEVNLDNMVPNNEFNHYYWAQCAYILGDDGWLKVFPESSPEACITWSGYRRDTFNFLRRTQNDDGSWTGSAGWRYVGPVYVTALALTIMQLDKAALPIYQR